MEKKQKIMTVDTIDRQQRYVASQKERQGLGIVFAEAFLRGMRDLGYKNPAWALAEQLDNSFQAAADVVSIRFGYESNNKTQVKPDRIAICDNGNGMIKEMISYAVRWGGTDRENDRTGFGRYGYGLPSSAVSIAKRYTVYSKIPTDKWYAVTVDIGELADAAGDAKKTEELLAPKAATLPKWVIDGAKGADTLDLSSLKSGTVIVFDEMDRLKALTGWIKSETLRTKLLQHFGVIYRHWIPERRISVDGVATEAVDPLFLMEHGRFFAETSVRAERIDVHDAFEVESSRGRTGTITLRASVLPPNFQLVDPSQYGRKGAKTNKRLPIMKEYNGLIFCRERRQIDTVAPPWTKFQNFDANVKIEIDFDPELDEYFGITTAKQQIVVDELMWEKLTQKGKASAGLRDLVESMRSRFGQLQKALKAKAENTVNANGEPRPSVSAMESTEKFKGTVSEPTTAQREEAEKNVEAAAADRAAASGRPVEEVRAQVVAETNKRHWEVEFAAIPEGPFYRPMRLGEQKRLIINTDHPFHSKVFEVVGPEARAALEVLLLVIAERELEVKNEAESFYRAERNQWSERLRHALDALVATDAMTDKAAAVAEQMQMDAEEQPQSAA